MKATTANVLMVLANGFHPDPRVHKEARTLVEHGFAVTILCLDRDQNLAPEERIDGIHIRRLRVGRVRRGKAGSLAGSLARFYFRALKAARASHSSRPFHLVHCHDFDTILLGLRLRRLLRAPVVYDLHDLYASYFDSRLLRRAVQKIDERVYRAVDGMILVNDRFRSLPHVGRCATEVIMNVSPRAGSVRSPATTSGSSMPATSTPPATCATR